jgi:hypothetical protein
LLAGIACACSAPPAPPVRAAAATAPALALGPARYLITDHLGVMFDEAGQGSTVPRAEPAIVDGVRVVVDGGLVVGSARHADRLSGLRSLPARLGGGFVIWSEDRVYRADAFLGELRPLADVGATGGARPWLGSILLRTPSGLLELDPASLALRRAAAPGVADALALDARRAARVDALGRASITTDGGATWIDLLATRGAVVSALREGEAGDLVLVTTAGPHLALGPGGLQVVEVPPDRVSALGEPRSASPLLGGALAATSRALPGEIVAHAVAAGALLDGGRLLVMREGGLRVLAAESGVPVADTDLGGLDERFARCQPVVVGAPPRAALACAGEAGAEVIELDGALARPALAATFPGAGGGFIGGPRGRLAFDGGCGPDAPRGGDLGPGNARATSEPEDPDAAPPPEPPAPAEPPPDDEARVCLRAGPSRWIERRLRGADARRLYRWVPGDDGSVTALILGDADAPDAGVDAGPRQARGGDAPASVGDGVRVVHLDPDDAALLGGAYPAVPTPQKELPFRTVDPEFWQDEDGAVRGWIRLPPETEEKPLVAPSAQGATKRMLRVSSARGGRSAGVRIDAAGHVAVLALPEGVTEVVTGGRFGLAMARHDGVDAWFETLDGGVAWTPVEGPPTGSLEAPSDEQAPFACSPAGCAWGTGVVRLGWGSPPPGAAAALALAPALDPKPRDPGPIALRCRLDEASAPWPTSPPGRAAKSPPPIALRLAPGTLGEVHGHAFRGEVMPPFQPSAALRHLSARDATLDSNQGAAIPLLGDGPRGGVDLLLMLGDRMLRAGGGGLLPFHAGKPIIAATAPDGALVWLDADRGVMSLSRGAATTQVLRMNRVPEVSRLRVTLAQRPGGRGLAVVAYSAGSGEVLAGDVELGRAQVAPLTALGRLETLSEAGVGACASLKATHRFLAELPVSLRVSGQGGEALLDQQVTAAVWIEASPERLCVLGVEAALPRDAATVLSASLGKAASASVRSQGRAVRASCAMPAR